VKTSNQLKAHIRNLSKAKNVEAEVLLRNFMLERFLERIAVSQYRDNFILKGGMLITALVGINTRSTMDMDATLKGQTLTEHEVAAIVDEIISTPVDDNVFFTLLGIDEIREEAIYPGYRVSLGAILEKTKQTLKVDITTGDTVTPTEVDYNFKLMFESRSISIKAYTLETVLAEKFETIITRGITNTRMRDFYDVHILTGELSFNAGIFRDALKNTVKKRETAEQMSYPMAVIHTIAGSEIMINQWQQYRKKYNYAADVTWEMPISALDKLAQISATEEM
jgi:predicted nucleotidyltransferase component of viral defense system